MCVTLTKEVVFLCVRFEGLRVIYAFMYATGNTAVNIVLYRGTTLIFYLKIACLTNTMDGNVKKSKRGIVQVITCVEHKLQTEWTKWT